MNTPPRDVTAVPKRPLTMTTDRPREACAEFRIGVRSVPYLADHAFQDMVVLPGSFYLAVARCVDRELTQRVPGLIRNVTFHSPLILWPDDTVIRVDLRALARGVSGTGSTKLVPRAAVPGLSLDGTPPLSKSTARRQAGRPPAGIDPITIAGFQARAQSVIGADQFYKRLRQNGNQYGPSFQRAVSIWRAGNQSLASLAAERRDGEREPLGLEPSLLDAMTQVLASIVVERGKTFILRSIEQVAMSDGEFPESLWGHAVLQHEDDERQSFVGTVRIVDQSGRSCVELSGVSFAFLERMDAPEKAARTTFVVASNFTADPIEESLKFWGDHFHAPVQVEFAPYDQIFQQLLEGGAFCTCT
jgi:acyl transferase domain-containing protein